MIDRRILLASIASLLGFAAFRWLRASPAQAAEKFEIEKTDAEWRARLTPQQYEILRKQGTERPGSSPLLNEHRKGIFACAGCDLPLFSSETKFESGTGWPSFYQPLDNAVGKSELDPRLAELVRLRASQINGCAYCVDMHSRDALAAGEDERKLFAVTAWRESPLFNERERAALALTDAVTLIAQPAGLDDAYEAAAQFFETGELAALLYAIVTINGWNRLAVASHMVFEP